MKKKIMVTLMALACIGCAASASQTIRPDHPPGAEWLIEGTQSGFGKLIITINGNSVIQGSMSVWSGDGKFEGVYEGKTVLAVCDKGSGYVRTRCVVSLNGEKVTTLYFRAI